MFEKNGAIARVAVERLGNATDGSFQMGVEEFTDETFDINI